MPKVISTPVERMARFAEEFDDYQLTGDCLTCKYCNIQIKSCKKSLVVQHLRTNVHLAKKTYTATLGVIPTAATAFYYQEPTTSYDDVFIAELCEALIAADIPFNRLSNNMFREFLQKYTLRNIPDQTLLRKYYVSEVYEAKVHLLREKAAGMKLWVSIDETTDVGQRFVACFVFGILGVEEERGKCYLGNIACLPKINHSTIAAFFNDSLQFLWPHQVLYNNVLLVTTGAASYMSKAMNSLQVLYPKMIHVTCLAHGFHRVAELVRQAHPKVNKLISTVKSIFLKAPDRIEKFQELAPGVPLPPCPIVTRWSTWLDAAHYYAKYLPEITAVIMSLDSTETQSILECQKLLEEESLLINLSFITNCFSIITKNIAKLEISGLSLSTSIELITEVETKLEEMNDTQFHQKLKSVISKNKGFIILKRLDAYVNGKVLKIEEENMNDDRDPLKILSAEDMASFKYAPVVSCDVERVFSQYKTILADNNHRSFNFDNLKINLIVKCNE